MTKKTIAVFLAAGAIGLAGTTGAAQDAASGRAGTQDKDAKHQHADPQHHAMMMHGMTDAQFVPMMIRHHQDGIEMARVEEAKGTSAAVKALAAKIRQAQERELAELKSHAARVAGARGTAGHADHGKAAGAEKRDEHDQMQQEMQQESQRMMRRLESASGGGVDEAFLEEMARHHQSAIQMVQNTKFQDAELRKMAQKMAADQKQELAELKKHQGAHKSGK